MPDQSYRKVDIDAFDEDQYVEEEEQLASGSAAVVDVKAIQSEVRSFIQKYRHLTQEGEAHDPDFSCNIGAILQEQLHQR